MHGKERLGHDEVDWNYLDSWSICKVGKAKVKSIYIMRNILNFITTHSIMAILVASVISKSPISDSTAGELSDGFSTPFHFQSPQSIQISQFEIRSNS